MRYGWNDGEIKLSRARISRKVSRSGDGMLGGKGGLVMMRSGLQRGWLLEQDTRVVR